MYDNKSKKLQVVDFDKQLQYEKEKIINKVCQWLKDNVCYSDSMKEWIICFLDEDDMIKDFKNCMNEITR